MLFPTFFNQLRANAIEAEKYSKRIVDMNIQELIGYRVLLKVSGGRFSNESVTEYKILEIAPSGNWVKLQNIGGNKFWKSLTEISFVEKLQEINAGRPKEAD